MLARDRAAWGDEEIDYQVTTPVSSVPARTNARSPVTGFSYTSPALLISSPYI